MSENKALLVSYFPLLDSQKILDLPGADATEEDHPKIQAAIDKAMQGAPIVEGILWMKDDDGNPAPVFMMSHSAHKLAAHMEQWAEYDMSRFTFYIEERGDEYAALLMPNIRKGQERWAMARQLFHGIKINLDEWDFHVLFKPLDVWCPSSATFRMIKDELPTRQRLGMMDISCLPKDDPSKLDPVQIRWLPKMRINPKVQAEYAKQHFDHLFAEGKENNSPE